MPSAAVKKEGCSTVGVAEVDHRETHRRVSDFDRPALLVYLALGQNFQLRFINAGTAWVGTGSEKKKP